MPKLVVVETPPAYVIDSSVALKWSLEEPGTAEATALLGQVLYAPELIFLEVGNTLARKAADGLIPADFPQQALEKLTRSFDRFLEDRLVAPLAAKLAVELDHPIYDCVFLASVLVLRSAGKIGEDLRRLGIQNCVLITADKKFFRRVQGTQYASMVCMLLD